MASLNEVSILQPSFVNDEVSSQVYEAVAPKTRDALTKAANTVELQAQETLDGLKGTVSLKDLLLSLLSPGEFLIESCPVLKAHTFAMYREGTLPSAPSSSILEATKSLSTPSESESESKSKTNAKPPSSSSSDPSSLSSANNTSTVRTVTMSVLLTNSRLLFLDVGQGKQVRLRELPSNNDMMTQRTFSVHSRVHESIFCYSAPLQNISGASLDLNDCTLSAETVTIRKPWWPIIFTVIGFFAIFIGALNKFIYLDLESTIQYVLIAVGSVLVFSTFIAMLVMFSHDTFTQPPVRESWRRVQLGVLDPLTQKNIVVCIDMELSVRMADAALMIRHLNEMCPFLQGRDFSQFLSRATASNAAISSSSSSVSSALNSASLSSGSIPNAAISSSPSSQSPASKPVVAISRNLDSIEVVDLPSSPEKHHDSALHANVNADQASSQRYNAPLGSARQQQQQQHHTVLSESSSSLSDVPKGNNNNVIPVMTSEEAQQQKEQKVNLWSSKYMSSISKSSPSLSVQRQRTSAAIISNIISTPTPSPAPAPPAAL